MTQAVVGEGAPRATRAHPAPSRRCLPARGLHQTYPRTAACSITRTRSWDIRTYGARKAPTPSIARALSRGVIAKSACRFRPTPNRSTRLLRHASVQARHGPATCSTSLVTWGFPRVALAASKPWARVGASSRAAEEDGPQHCDSSLSSGDDAAHMGLYARNVHSLWRLRILG